MKFHVTRHWLELASQWLDNFCHSTLTRLDQVMTLTRFEKNSDDSESTLTRRACYSDSTKITRAHHCPQMTGNCDLATSTDYAKIFSSYHWCWKLKNYCEAINTAIVRTTRILEKKKFLVFGKYILIWFLLNSRTLNEKHKTKIMRFRCPV